VQSGADRCGRCVHRAPAGMLPASAFKVGRFENRRPRRRVSSGTFELDEAGEFPNCC
jgi:hypothetical protein